MAINTHYDNLQVARNAPSDVIRAAYKDITQKYNSDQRHDADAAQAMGEIHKSYAILSNPIQRAEYDRRLLELESAQVGKVSPVSSENKTKIPTQWLVYALICLALLITVLWFAFSSDDDVSESAQSQQNKVAEVNQGISSQTSLAPIAPAIQPDAVQNKQLAPAIPADRIPAHDQVSIDKFIGIWKGTNGSSAGQQTLDISRKSENSMVFRLDAKAGESIGQIYGVAEFDNSYANFYSQEYGCSILFTIKSNVLNLNTSSCQGYHAKGVSFDGSYIKPTPKSVLKPSTVKTVRTKPENTSDSASQSLQSEIFPSAPINAPKLLKFVATVKDAEGNVSKIELLAKNKAAARAIIRDYRGNPKVVKIKEL